MLARILTSTLAALLLSAAFPASAYQHRATRLGNPATRFAPTLYTAEDLRDRFRDPKLQPDFGEVLRQWGWPGDLKDLFHAALNEPIRPHQIPVGNVMPFMSSRKNGRPICLKEVLWAGKEPIQAFAFDFVSKGRKYVCITPRPCSNFFVVDKGPADPVDTTLTIECEAPPRQFTGRDIEVCLTVRNTGKAMEPKAMIRLPLPEGTTLVGTSDNGFEERRNITWNVGALAPNTGKKVCAVLQASQPGRLQFTGEVGGKQAPPDSCGTEIEILGVYGLLVEVIDIEDPVKAGNEARYVITVTNQGLQKHTNLRVIATLGDHHDLKSADGESSATVKDATITFDPVPVLEGKAVATWTVVTISNPPDNTVGLLDTRFVINVSSDQITNPIREEESTMLHQ